MTPIQETFTTGPTLTKTPGAIEERLVFDFQMELQTIKITGLLGMGIEIDTGDDVVFLPGDTARAVIKAMIRADQFAGIYKDDPSL